MGKELTGTHWVAELTKHGVREVRCDSWAGYVNFLNEALLDFRSYVFRGHASEEWKLESTLDRALNKTATNTSKQRDEHLAKFRYASRGRRGPTPALLAEENDWWALGQHHGLATPLLDWSESPYVAAYFAFHAEHPESEDQRSQNRIVYALSRVAVEEKNNQLTLESIKVGKEPSLITFVRPMIDENQRLITQRGLFTRAPDNVPIERWVRTNFKETAGGAKLIRMSIPSTERDTAMKNLNRMNINHLSLFPDLDGAAKYCNFELAIKNY